MATANRFTAVSLAALMAAASGACAAKKPLSFDYKPLANSSPCRPQTVQTIKQGDKVVGSDLLTAPFDEVCGAKQEAAHESEADVRVRLAQIQGAVQVIISRFNAKNSTPAERIEAMHAIISNLDSQDADVRGAQQAANKTAGVDEQGIRAYLAKTKCVTVSGKDYCP